MPERLASFALLTLLTTACTSSTVSVPDPVDLTGPRTWYGSVGPLVISRCATCHRSDDIAPFSLDAIGHVRPRLAAIRAAVESGEMPPFPPDQSEASGCPKITDTRLMSADERAFLVAWIDEGAPEGEFRELPPAKPNKPLGDPAERWTMPEPYESKVTVGDDYRCFVVRPKNLLSIPISAVTAEPGNRAIVHHAAVYLVPPNQLDRLKELEAADPEPGYECFGGIGIDVAYPAGAWVPGNDAPLVPPNGATGYYLSPGWVWVVQNHYNFTGTSQSDQSSIVAWRGPEIASEIPHALFLGKTDFALPAFSNTTIEASGDVLPTGSTITSINQGTAGRIYAVWGHMHLLGKTIEMDLVKPDGTEQCLLRIPRWDFHWQSVYRLEGFVSAAAGDRVRVRCSYENTGPNEVHYGEGTADEMCFGSVAMLNP